MAVKSLEGKRIVITKSVREQDDILEALEREGAEVVQMPLIEIKAVEDPDKTMEVFKGIATYEWIAFSSVNGVVHFFETFFKAFKDIRSIGPARIACVGNQTAAVVRDLHLAVDLIPEKQTGVGLAERLIDTGSLPSAYVLWVTGDKTNKEATDLLEGKGEAIVDLFQVYKSELRDLSEDKAAADFRKAGADGLLFASPSAAESFRDQVKYLLRGQKATAPKTVSIGPVTSQAMQKLKIPLDKESSSPDAKDVVAAFKALLS